jgi:RNA polymerase sigma factor (sigma-70 family)
MNQISSGMGVLCGYRLVGPDANPALSCKTVPRPETLLPDGATDRGVHILGCSCVTTSPAIDWQATLAQHDRWLRTIVLARVRERQAVDDVMQEVALAAVRQSAPLADVAKLAPWLYRLAVRQSLLYRRKCGRRRRLQESYENRQERHQANGHLGQSVLEPLGWLLSDERQALVRQALGRIAPRDREILLLKYTENWNYGQIATHLGVSHSAIEARLHRARRRLREQLLDLEVSVG